MIETKRRPRLPGRHQAAAAAAAVHQAPQQLGTMASYDMATLPIEDFLNYSPSLALAIIAMTLFFLGGVAIACKTWRRPYRFMHTMTWVLLRCRQAGC